MLEVLLGLYHISEGYELHAMVKEMSEQWERGDYEGAVRTYLHWMETRETFSPTMNLAVDSFCYMMDEYVVPSVAQLADNAAKREAVDSAALTVREAVERAREAESQQTGMVATDDTAAGRGWRPTLRRGEQSEWVLYLQKLLDAQGISPGRLDSDFGGATERAVRTFQEKCDLVVDGVVGLKTWGELEANA